MIDKITAGILFSFGFRLVDKEGNEWSITGIENVVNATILKIEAYTVNLWINMVKIGTDYWILKRPYSQLTKSIVVEGEDIIPIVELAKIEGFLISSKDYILNQQKISCSIRQGNFMLIMKGFNFALWIEGNPTIVDNQEQLFQKLYSLHFIDLPEGTYKLIV